MRPKHSKLTEKQTGRLCEHFIAGTPARIAAELVGVNKNTAALFCHRLREIVAARVEDECPIRSEIEIGESYLGGVRTGKRGRGAAGKVPVFGILKRRGRGLHKDDSERRSCNADAYHKGQIEPDSIVYSEAFGTYYVLDLSGFRHHRINRRKASIGHSWCGEPIGSFHD
jgi:transposase